MTEVLVESEEFMFASNGNKGFIFANGRIRKFPKCNVQMCE